MAISSTGLAYVGFFFSNLFHLLLLLSRFSTLQSILDSFVTPFIEPQSGFHFDPIVVCDFTALYPSLVIAYNLCYSSCAGKLDYHSTRQEMQREGQTTGRIGPFQYAERRTASVINHHMKSISSSSKVGKKDKDRAYVIPTGSLFVSETVVKGVLPQVLGEILATRAMLKRAAKTYKKSAKNVPPSVLRSLEAKQLAVRWLMLFFLCSLFFFSLFFFAAARNS